MVLEGLITSQLNKHLGQFIEDLPKDQLKVSIFGGLNVDLRNLVIKKTCLDAFKLPLSVKLGTVGRLVLKAKLTKLSSCPVEARLEDVFLVLHPNANIHIDKAKEIAEQLANKLENLTTVQEWKLQENVQESETPSLRNTKHARKVAKKKAKAQAKKDAKATKAAAKREKERLKRLKAKQSSAGSTDEKEGDVSDDEDEMDNYDEGGSSFVERLVTKVVDNIQVSINNIHIRIEGADPRGVPFSVGVVVGELSTHTTNSKGEPHFSVKEAIVYRVAALRDFFVYVNTDRDRGSGRIKEGLTGMRAMCTDPKFRAKECDFLLPPLSGEVKIVQAKRESRNPNMSIFVSFSALGLSLSQPQYHALMSMLADITMAQATINKRLEFLKEEFRRGTEEEGVKYLKMYKRTLNCDWEPKLSKDEKKEMTAIENEVAYEDLRVWRYAGWKIHRREVDPSYYITERGADQKGGKGGGFFSSSASKQKQAYIKLTDQDYLYELRKAIADFDSGAAKKEEQKEAAPESEGKSESSELVVQQEIRFTLDSLQVLLKDVERRTLFRFAASHIRSHVIARPNNTIIAAGIESIDLEDHYTQNTIHPLLIAVPPPTSPPQESDILKMPLCHKGKLHLDVSNIRSEVLGIIDKNAVPKDKKAHQIPWLQAYIEQGPLDKSCDTLVRARVRQVGVVVHALWIDRIMQFFAAPKQQMDFSAVSDWSSSRLEALSAATAVQMYDSVSTRSSLMLDVEVKAPNIVVPADPTTHSTDSVCLDLGVLRMKSTVQSEETCQRVAEHIARVESSSSTLLMQSRTPTLQQLKQRAGVQALSNDETFLVQCYDRIDLDVVNIQCYLTDQLPELFERMSSSESKTTRQRPSEKQEKKAYLIEPFDVNVEIGQSVMPSADWLPNLRVKGHLEKLPMQLTVSALTRLVMLSTAFQGMGVPFDELDGDDHSDPFEMIHEDEVIVSEVKKAEEAKKAKQKAADAERKKKSNVESDRVYFSELIKLLGSEAEARKVFAMHEGEDGGSGYVLRTAVVEFLERRADRLKSNKRMQVDFFIGELRATFFDDTPKRGPVGSGVVVEGLGRPVFEVKVEGILFGFYARDYDMMACVGLKSVSLEDCQYPIQGPLRYLMRTVSPGELTNPNDGVHSEAKTQVVDQSEQSFIKVRYTAIKPESSDYRTTRVRSSLNAMVGAIVLSVDPDSVYRIAIFAMKTLLPAVSPPPDTEFDRLRKNQMMYMSKSNRRLSDARDLARTSDDIDVTSFSFTIPSAPPTVDFGDEKNEDGTLEDEDEKDSKDDCEEEKTPRGTFVDLAVTFECGGIEIWLNAKQKRVLVVGLRDFGAFVELYPTGSLHCDVWWSKFAVEDHTPAGRRKYRDIISIQEAETGFSDSIITPGDDSGFELFSPRTGGKKAKAYIERKKREQKKRAENCLISVSYDQYSSKDSDYPGYNADVSGTIRGFRVVVLMRVIQEMVAFGTGGPIKRLLAELAEDQHAVEQARRASVSISRSVVSGLQRSMKGSQLAETLRNAKREREQRKLSPTPEGFVGINVTLADISVCVPLHSFSDEWIEARLDHVAVFNQLLPSKASLERVPDEHNEHLRSSCLKYCPKPDSADASVASENPVVVEEKSTDSLEAVPDTWKSLKAYDKATQNEETAFSTLRGIPYVGDDRCTYYQRFWVQLKSFGVMLRVNSKTASDVTRTQARNYFKGTKLAELSETTPKETREDSTLISLPVVRTRRTLVCADLDPVHEHTGAAVLFGRIHIDVSQCMYWFVLGLVDNAGNLSETAQTVIWTPQDEGIGTKKPTPAPPSSPPPRPLGRLGGSKINRTGERKYGDTLSAPKGERIRSDSAEDRALAALSGGAVKYPKSKGKTPGKSGGARSRSSKSKSSKKSEPRPTISVNVEFGGLGIRLLYLDGGIRSEQKGADHAFDGRFGLATFDLRAVNAAVQIGPLPEDMLIKAAMLGVNIKDVSFAGEKGRRGRTVPEGFRNLLDLSLAPENCEPYQKALDAGDEEFKYTHSPLTVIMHTARISDPIPLPGGGVTVQVHTAICAHLEHFRLIAGPVIMKIAPFFDLSVVEDASDDGVVVQTLTADQKLEQEKDMMAAKGRELLLGDLYSNGLSGHTGGIGLANLILLLDFSAVDSPLLPDVYLRKPHVPQRRSGGFYQAIVNRAKRLTGGEQNDDDDFITHNTNDPEGEQKSSEGGDQDGEGGEGTANDDASKVDVKKSTSVLVTIDDPEVLLLESFTSEQVRGLSLAMTLRAEVNMAADDLSVKADLTNFGVLHADVVGVPATKFVPAHVEVRRSESTPIILPFAIHATVQQNLSPFLPQQPAQQVNVIVDYIAVQLSFSDYQLSMRALKNMGVMAAEASPEPKKTDALSKEGDSTAVATVDGANEAKGSRGGALNLLKELFGHQMVSFIAKGIEIVVINDALQSQIPVARFTISEMVATVFALLYDRQIALRLGLSGDYYNQQLVCWEPMLEPWGLNVDILQRYRARECNVLQYREAVYARVQDRITTKLRDTKLALMKQTSSGSDVSIELLGSGEQKTVTATTRPRKESCFQGPKEEVVPKGMDVEILNKVLCSPVLSTHVSVKSNEQLNINVTDHMYRSVLSSVYLLTKAMEALDDEDDGRDERQQAYTSYRIDNDLELPLFVRRFMTPSTRREKQAHLHQKSKHAHSSQAGELFWDEEWISVPARAQLGLEFPEYTKVRSRRLEVKFDPRHPVAQRYLMRRQQADESPAPLSWIWEVTTPFSNAHSVAISDGVKLSTAVFVCSMSVTKARRVFHVRSAVRFKNRSCHTLALAPAERSSDSSVAKSQEMLVEPGASIWLPLFPSDVHRNPVAPLRQYDAFCKSITEHKLTIRPANLTAGTVGDGVEEPVQYEPSTAFACSLYEEKFNRDCMIPKSGLPSTLACRPVNHHVFAAGRAERSVFGVVKTLLLDVDRAGPLFDGMFELRNHERALKNQSVPDAGALGVTLNKVAENYGSSFQITSAVLVKNLLCESADVRVLSSPNTGSSNSGGEPGQRDPQNRQQQSAASLLGASRIGVGGTFICPGGPITETTALQVRIPSLQIDWSAAVTFGDKVLKVVRKLRKKLKAQEEKRLSRYRMLKEKQHVRRKVALDSEARSQFLCESVQFIVPTENPHGQKLFLKVEAFVSCGLGDNCGSVELNIFVPFWLYDMTDLGLHYSAKKTPGMECPRGELLENRYRRKLVITVDCARNLPKGDPYVECWIGRPTSEPQLHSTTHFKTKVCRRPSSDAPAWSERFELWFEPYRCTDMGSQSVRNRKKLKAPESKETAVSSAIQSRTGSAKSVSDGNYSRASEADVNNQGILSRNLPSLLHIRVRSKKSLSRDSLLACGAVPMKHFAPRESSVTVEEVSGQSSDEKKAEDSASNGFTTITVLLRDKNKRRTNAALQLSYRWAEEKVAFTALDSPSGYVTAASGTVGTSVQQPVDHYFSSFGTSVRDFISEDDGAYRKPSMFTFDPKNEDDRLLIRGCEHSAWSQASGAAEINVVGHEQDISFCGDRDAQKYNFDCPLFTVGMNVRVGSGIFARTKVVTFVPRFFIVNTLPYPIQIRQFGVNAGDCIPGESMDFFTTKQRAKIARSQDPNRMDQLPGWRCKCPCDRMDDTIVFDGEKVKYEHTELCREDGLIKPYSMINVPEQKVKGGWNEQTWRLIDSIYRQYNPNMRELLRFGRHASAFMVLMPGQVHPWYWYSRNQQQKVSFRRLYTSLRPSDPFKKTRVVPPMTVSSLNSWNWSGYFSLDTALTKTFLVRNCKSEEAWFSRVQVARRGMSSFVSFSSSDDWQLSPPSLRASVPFVIENRCDSVAFQIRQRLNRNVPKPSGAILKIPKAPAFPYARRTAHSVWSTCTPGTIMPYAMEEPADDENGTIVELLVEPKRNAYNEIQRFMGEVKALDINNPGVRNKVKIVVPKTPEDLKREGRMGTERLNEYDLKETFIFYGVISSGCNRVLVFSDEPSTLESGHSMVDLDVVGGWSRMVEHTESEEEKRARLKATKRGMVVAPKPKMVETVLPTSMMKSDEMSEAEFQAACHSFHISVSASLNTLRGAFMRMEYLLAHSKRQLRKFQRHLHNYINGGLRRPLEMPGHVSELSVHVVDGLEFASQSRVYVVVRLPQDKRKEARVTRKSVAVAGRPKWDERACLPITGLAEDQYVILECYQHRSILSDKWLGIARVRLRDLDSFKPVSRFLRLKDTKSNRLTNNGVLRVVFHRIPLSEDVMRKAIVREKHNISTRRRVLRGIRRRIMVLKPRRVPNLALEHKQRLPFLAGPPGALIEDPTIASQDTVSMTARQNGALVVGSSDEKSSVVTAEDEAKTPLTELETAEGQEEKANDEEFKVPLADPMPPGLSGFEVSFSVEGVHGLPDLVRARCDLPDSAIPKGRVVCLIEIPALQFRTGCIIWEPGLARASQGRGGEGIKWATYISMDDLALKKECKFVLPEVVMEMVSLEEASIYMCMYYFPAISEQRPTRNTRRGETTLGGLTALMEDEEVDDTAESKAPAEEKRKGLPRRQSSHWDSEADLLQRTFSSFFTLPMGDERGDGIKLNLMQPTPTRLGYTHIPIEYIASSAKLSLEDRIVRRQVQRAAAEKRKKAMRKKLEKKLKQYQSSHKGQRITRADMEEMAGEAQAEQEEESTLLTMDQVWPGWFEYGCPVKKEEEKDDSDNGNAKPVMGDADAVEWLLGQWLPILPDGADVTFSARRAELSSQRDPEKHKSDKAEQKRVKAQAARYKKMKHVPESLRDHEVKFAIKVSCARFRSNRELQRADMSLHMSIPHVGLSLINGVPEEFLYISVQGIEADIGDCCEYQSVEFAITRIQIDDMDDDANFPIILAPTAVKKRRPMLILAINKEKPPIPVPVHFFRYFSILLQSLDVSVDEGFIWRLLKYLNSLLSAGKAVFGKSTSLVDDSSPLALDTSTARDLFIGCDNEIVRLADSVESKEDEDDAETALRRWQETLFEASDSSQMLMSMHDVCQPPSDVPMEVSFSELQIHSIKAMLSFRVAADERDLDPKMQRMLVLVNLIAPLISNLEEAELCLNQKEFKSIKDTAGLIGNVIMRAYKAEIQQQITKLALNAVLPGDPLSLVTSIGGAAADVFTEPAEGLVKSPAAFGSGLAKSSVQFVSTVLQASFGSVGNALGRVEGMLGYMGGETATVRRLRRSGKSTNILSGAATGLMGFFGGIAEAFVGIGKNVVDGTRGEGNSVLGAIKGLGKGLFQFATKTAGSTVFLGRSLVDGLGNTMNTALHGNVKNERFRLRRYLEPGKPITIYDETAAFQASKGVLMADEEEDEVERKTQ